MFLIFSHLKKIIEGLKRTDKTDTTDKSLLKGILLISIMINLSLDIFITGNKSQLFYLSLLL